MIWLAAVLFVMHTFGLVLIPLAFGSDYTPEVPERVAAGHDSEPPGDVGVIGQVKNLFFKYWDTMITKFGLIWTLTTLDYDYLGSSGFDLVDYILQMIRGGMSLAQVALVVKLVQSWRAAS